MDTDFSKLCYGCMEFSSEEYGCKKCGHLNNSSYAKHLLKPGTFVGDRYIVGKMEKSDGEGHSYIGYDTDKQRKVVIREFVPNALAYRDPKNGRVTVKESNQIVFEEQKQIFLEIAKKLYKHRKLDSVIPIFDIFEQNGTIYSIYDYIPSVTLGEFLTKNAPFFSWEQVQILFMPVLRTLSALHADELFHRGISPLTIVIDTNGDLKLTDFLVPAARTAKSQLTSRLYTGYAAPEQYSMSGWQGPWTDVYSIAAVMYFSLTGIVPQDSMARIKQDLLKPAATLNAKLPGNVNYILSISMLLTPDKRCESINDFINAIEAPESDLEQKNSILMKEILITPKNTAKSIAPLLRDPHRDDKKKKKKRRKRVKKRALFPYYFFSFVISLSLMLGLSYIYFEDIADALGILPDNSEIEQYIESMGTTGSDEEELYVAPNLLEMTLDNIKSMDGYWEKFTTSETHEYNDNYPRGTVISQSPDEGALSKTKIVMKIVVSLGPEQMVNYVGSRVENAQFYFDQRKIAYEIIEEFSTAYSEGVILSIDKVDNIMKIRVSKGPEVVTPPDSIINNGIYPGFNDDDIPVILG